jgi:hypothetical protein
MAMSSSLATLVGTVSSSAFAPAPSLIGTIRSPVASPRLTDTSELAVCVKPSCGSGSRVSPGPSARPPSESTAGGWVRSNVCGVRFGYARDGGGECAMVVMKCREGKMLVVASSNASARG